MITIDKNRKKELELACANHFVDKLYLFGSATGSSFDKERSDVDLVVQFTDELDVLDFADNYFSLLNVLKNIFKRNIDLLSYRALKNPIIIEEIERSKVQLYAA